MPKDTTPSVARRARLMAARENIPPEKAAAIIRKRDAEQEANNAVAFQSVYPPPIPEPLPEVPSTSSAAGPTGNKIRANVAIKALFRLFAKSDFKHDFGEHDTGRDWITNVDRKRFEQMVQKISIKQRTAMLNMFDKKFPRPPSGNPRDAKGDNLYEILRKDIARELYPDPVGDSTEFVKETEVLQQVGINYEAVKERIAKHFAGPGRNEAFEEETSFGHGGLARKYTVRAQKYKNLNPAGKEVDTRNLSSLFKDVTGGKTNFGLLVDAATGLSVTLVGDATLTPDPGVPCSFAILQNVESDADSATGASDFKIRTGTNPATVAILRDVGTSTVIFPIWSEDALSAREAENLFSKIQIILNRVDNGEIEASILIGTKTFNIPDVGTTSNVKNASLNGLASWFAKEILIDVNEKEEAARKPYLYALLKRMGDWCQALSLLDRVRTYTMLDPKTRDPILTDAGATTTATLQSLIAGGYEIGLVTNDRILLAYATLLGLNVYFTSASPLNCLIYFKNEDDVSSPADVEARITDIATTVLVPLLQGVSGTAEAATAADLDSLIAAIHAAGVSSIGVPIFDAVVGVVETNLRRPKITPGAVRVLKPIAVAFASKVCLANLGELRTNFEELEVQFKAAMSDYLLDGGDQKRRYDGITNAVAALNRYKTDIEHNGVLIGRINAGKYAGSYGSDESVFFDLAVKMGAGSRIMGSEQMTRAKNILLTTRDDIKQITQKAFVFNSADYIPSLPSFVDASGIRLGGITDKDEENLTALYGAFDAVRASLGTMSGGGRMKGGALDINEINRGYNALTQRRLFPYTSINLNVAINKLAAIAASNANAKALLDQLDDLPAAKVGSYYRDEKSRPYSVIDSVLITREDGSFLFDQLETLLTEAPQDNPEFKAYQNFIIFRAILLYHDALYAELEKIRDEPGIEIERVWNTDSRRWERGNVEPEDTEYTEGALLGLQRVVREASLLRFATDKIVRPGGQYAAAISLILNGWKGEGVDEDSLRAFAATVDQGATLFGPALNPSTFIGRVDYTQTYLQNVRTTVENNYNRFPAIPVPPSVEGKPADYEPREDEYMTEAKLEVDINAAEAIVLPFAPTTSVPPPRPAFGFQGYGVAAGQGPPAGFGGPVGVAAQSAPRPAFSFQPAAPLQSNANGAPPGSNWRGGRRRLYAGLRKRTGSGSDPDV